MESADLTLKHFFACWGMKPRRKLSLSSATVCYMGYNVFWSTCGMVALIYSTQMLSVHLSDRLQFKVCQKHFQWNAIIKAINKRPCHIFAKTLLYVNKHLIFLLHFYSCLLNCFSVKHWHRKELAITPEWPSISYWLTGQSSETAIPEAPTCAPTWIDYKKAYDSVPHTWILECLKMYKINTTLTAFIWNSVKLWKTTLEVTFCCSA